MAESVHAAALEGQGFRRVQTAPHCDSVTAEFMKDNPDSSPFFYKTTVEEVSATIAIDELGEPWLATGTISLEDLGFTECPTRY